MDKKVYSNENPKTNKPVKANPILYFACLLCCMVVITTNLTGNMYAKFVASESAADSAKVAKWDVSVNFTGQNQYTLKDTDDQKTADYTFEVISNSEVALSYDVIVTLPEALPDTVKFNIGNVSPSISEDGLIYTFANLGTIAADGGTNNHTLQITSDFTHNSIDIKGIKVEIIAEQID